MLEMIYPNWPAPKNIHAFTTTRQGGVSLPSFDSLNMGSRTGDKLEHVTKNRILVKQAENLPSEPYWLHQIHSTAVLNISDILPQPVTDKVDDNATIEADASYTRQSGQVSVVLTADCLPVLFCALSGNEVAATHAGWRGLCHGILEETVKQFTCPAANILAWLGPAIGASKFEVGEEVKQQFADVLPEANDAFKLIPTTQNLTKKKYLADLYLLAKQRLAKVGVTHVYGGDYCTYSEVDKFYSYRRNNQTGRMASMIWFE